MAHSELPIPSHFEPEKVDQVWKVDYQNRAEDARDWANQHNIEPASADAVKIFLLLVDVQNTFCIPGFELYVGGRSGTGAVDDNRRLCAFIYRNLNAITRIGATMDTHLAMQIFHSIFLVNEKGEHPAPYTLITAEDVAQGIWKVNPEVSHNLGIETLYSQEFLRHYTEQLDRESKYDLTIWPYHAMLGGIGHALVSAVEEAIFYHSMARYSSPDFQVKGDNPLTENYSVIKPEVMEDAGGRKIAQINSVFMERLLSYDAIFIAGQAKSHCLAWTIEDLLHEITATDRCLTEKIYLLQDCTSPVVIPDVIDYSDQADEAFRRFADAGMHIVCSTDRLKGMPGISF